MATRIKVKAGEDLSNETVLRAIDLLEAGGTKKSACELLGIAYNTKRLDTIIKAYHDRMDFEKRQRAKRRGKPIDKEEATSIIEQYLDCGSMEAVAKTHFRSTALVKTTLDKYGALLKASKMDYFNPTFLPDECVSETFAEGDLVWSARYNCAAEVDTAYPRKDVYRVWLLGKDCQFAMQEAAELGSLKHLEELGVNINRVVKE